MSFKPFTRQSQLCSVQIVHQSMWFMKLNNSIATKSKYTYYSICERYLKVYLMSMICSVAVFAATISEPYVAVSTVACFLEYQSTGVMLTKWRHPVKDLHVAKQWFKLGFMVVVVTKALPSGSGHLISKDFMDLTIYRVCPVKVLLW